MFSWVFHHGTKYPEPSFFQILDIFGSFMDRIWQSSIIFFWTFMNSKLIECPSAARLPYIKNPVFTVSDILESANYQEAISANISKIKIEESLSQLMIIKILRTAILMTVCGADTIPLTCILRRYLYSSSSRVTPLLYSSSPQLPLSCTLLHQSYLLHHAYHLILYNNIWLCYGLYISL